MIDTNSPKSFLHTHLLRILGHKPKIASTEPKSFVSAPIEAVEEVTGNALLLETLLIEFSDIVGLNPYALLSHGFLELAQGQEALQAVVEYDQFSDGVLGRWRSIEDMSCMVGWIYQETLPKSFRKDFIDYVIRVDDLNEVMEMLSQGRWEKMRTWVHSHV
jgi:hypothetical protein